MGACTAMHLVLHLSLRLCRNGLLFHLFGYSLQDDYYNRWMTLNLVSPRINESCCAASPNVGSPVYTPNGLNYHGASSILRNKATNLEPPFLSTFLLSSVAVIMTLTHSSCSCSSTDTLSKEG
jgi:hypothetical protein